MSAALKNVTIKSHEIKWSKPPIIVGKGTLGKIYKVKYKEIDVIIKSSKDDLDAILEEFHIHYKLREHENILKFYGVILKADKIALIYEYTTYGKLSTFLKNNSSFLPSNAPSNMSSSSLLNNSIGWDIKSKLCHDIALALFHCHELNISNFNLKLDNIYLTNDWIVKIAGFNKNSGNDQSISTVHWVAPEAASFDQEMRLSFKDQPKLADVYSLGLIFWAIAMNGNVPYEGMTRDKIIEEKQNYNANEHLQNQLPKSIPSEFSNLIFKMTKYTPRQRPSLLAILCTLEGLYDFNNRTENLVSQSSRNLSTSKKTQSINSIESLINSSIRNSKHSNSTTNHQEHQLTKSDKDLLNQITELYLESEKLGFDWLIKSLKRLAVTEKKDPTKFFELINLDLNMSHRHVILGYFYEEGFGTTRDTRQAYKYYKKTAEDGDHYAQNHLALCYQDGIGIERDNLKAFDWFRESASGGNVSAQNNLAMCYDYGRGTSPNRAKAFSLYKSAAEGDNVMAQYSLSLCYDGGYGTDKKKKKAREWLKIAADNGNLAAIETLKARKRKNNWFVKRFLFSKKSSKRKTNNKIPQHIDYNQNVEGTVY